MFSLNKNIIKETIADSGIIYKRGERIFNLGNYYQKEADFEKQAFKYMIDGNYGDYDVTVEFVQSKIKYQCSCPYYGLGCKHTVAVCLDIVEHVARYKSLKEREEPTTPPSETDQLSYDEIRQLAYEDRIKRAKNELFTLTIGDTYKGEHLITNAQDKQYIVTVHDPAKDTGHCSCPDFNTNKLGACKHIMHVFTQIKAKKDFTERAQKEKAPFVHLYWNSTLEKPCYFYDRKLPAGIADEFNEYFNDKGEFSKNDTSKLFPLMERLSGKKNVKVDANVIQRVDNALLQKEIDEAMKGGCPDLPFIKASLYPYQKEGVNFAVYKKSAIIADEMGLGKTLQAITIALLKREIFGFKKTLIVCPASLKEQWYREIERFTGETATIISGSRNKRQETYAMNGDYFKITNYEAVLRDNLVIQRYRPDFVILDEAQRIKNFETKTAQAIKSIPHKQSLVISGTPLENKLEDLYSVVQFADPELFAPLWEFAANYFILKKSKKNRVFGYKGLNDIHSKLKSLVIRRRKEEVLKDLPEQVSNNYYIDLTKEQLEIHQGYLSSLLPILSKKFLTPMDIRRIQQLLVSMRMVCDSTFLIDRKTNLSPKLKELETIISDLVLENDRKVVIFTEWTTMTFLIGKSLSELGIPFVEFTGKIPVNKRQALINEFNQNPECKVFLATEAGGVGLNLQSADCVINFELPWNPAKLNQRIGRVMRIGQKSKCVNVINLIAKQSIEEKIYAGIQLKQELFDGVFDGTTDMVEFSQEKKAEFINRIREMLNDDQVIPAPEQSDPEELPESTPHFLNPKALGNEELNIAEEEDLEFEEQSSETDAATSPGATEQTGVKDTPAAPTETQEKMEQALEHGMQFLSGLMEMTTGKPITPDNEGKCIKVDKETGEVTMKFKLPGF